jgi:O-antigen/teichoic acid export membrane protein
MIKTAFGFLRRHGHANWALADQAMVSGVNFLTGILLARGLGIAEFGRFSLVWLVLVFVQSIQDNAITSPMMSIGPKQDLEQQATYYGGVFCQQTILALASTVVTWACFRFFGVISSAWNMAPLAMPLAAVILLCQTQDFLRRYFFTVQNPAASFVGDAIRYISQLAILSWIFLVSETAHNISAALWTIAGASGAGVLVVLTFVGRLEWATPALRRTALMNWRFSRWLVASAIVNWMSGNLFVVTAGALLGVTAVGALKAAQSLIGVTHILFQGLENVVPINAAKRYHAGGAAALVHYLAKVTRLGIATTAIIGLCFAIAPAFWFGLLFGPEFVEYSYLLYWYGALYVLMFLGVSVRFGLLATETTVPVFLAYTAAAVFSVATVYPLVRGLGLIGVMVGLCSIQLVLLGVMLMSFRRVLVRRRT